VFSPEFLQRLNAIAVFCVLVCASPAHAQQTGAQQKTPQQKTSLRRNPKTATATLLQQAMRSSMAGKPGAAVVVEVESGKIIAQEGMETAARRLATPGSTVKPFVLMALLKSQKFNSNEAFFCHHTLRIAGKRMDCTHPDLAAPLYAEEALAYSCNSYFAAMAERISADDLASTFQRVGFDSPTGWSQNEASGVVKKTQTLEQRQLQALGEENVEITPLELLAAYRNLAQQHRRQSKNPGDKTLGDRTKDKNGDKNNEDTNKDQTWDVIYRGLQDSTAYGMAHGAAPDGYNVAGKTGTANSATSALTHGWFAGYAPAEKPEIALVVYLEHGRGADAAAIARTIFTAYSKMKGAH
jgi:cell division protein FtsI/penicillin-binding protein 2